MTIDGFALVSPSANDSAHRGLQPYDILIWVEPRLNLRTSVLNLARVMSISLPVLNFPLLRNNPISFYTRKKKHSWIRWVRSSPYLECGPQKSFAKLASYVHPLANLRRLNFELCITTSCEPRFFPTLTSISSRCLSTLAATKGSILCRHCTLTVVIELTMLTAKAVKDSLPTQNHWIRSEYLLCAAVIRDLILFSRLEASRKRKCPPTGHRWRRKWHFGRRGWPVL